MKEPPTPPFGPSPDERMCIGCLGTKRVVLDKADNPLNYGCYECLCGQLDNQLRTGGAFRYHCLTASGTVERSTLSLPSVKTLMAFLQAPPPLSGWEGCDTLDGAYEKWKRIRAGYREFRFDTKNPEETLRCPHCTKPQLFNPEKCNQVTCGRETEAHDKKVRVGCGEHYCYVCQEDWDEAHRQMVRRFYNCPNADKHADRVNWVGHQRDAGGAEPAEAPLLIPSPHGRRQHLRVRRDDNSGVQNWYCYVCQGHWDAAHRATRSDIYCPNADQHAVRWDWVDRLRNLPLTNDGQVQNGGIPLFMILYGFFNLEQDRDGLRREIPVIRAEAQRLTLRLVTLDPGREGEPGALPDVPEEDEPLWANILDPAYPIYTFGHLPPDLHILPLSEEVQRLRRERTQWRMRQDTLRQLIAEYVPSPHQMSPEVLKILEERPETRPDPTQVTRRVRLPAFGQEGRRCRSYDGLPIDDFPPGTKVCVHYVGRWRRVRESAWEYRESALERFNGWRFGTVLKKRNSNSVCIAYWDGLNDEVHSGRHCLPFVMKLPPQEDTTPVECFGRLTITSAGDEKSNRSPSSPRAGAKHSAGAPNIGGDPN